MSKRGKAMNPAVLAARSGSASPSALVLRASLPQPVVPTLRQESPLPSFRSPASAVRSVEALTRAERPQLPATPRKPETIAHATAAAPLRSAADILRASPAPAPRELPRFSWIARKSKPATNPAEAAVNRQLRKVGAAALAAPESAVLSAGVNPADLANGLTTPTRGSWGVNGRSAKRGTPQAVREAPDDSVAEAPPPVAVTLSDATAGDAERGGPAVNVATPPTKPDPIGTGMNLAFLAAAAFVGWLALKGR